MLKFRCDCCGKEIPNPVDVVQIRLTPYAYIPERDDLMRIPFVGELCTECSDAFDAYFVARREEFAKGEDGQGALSEKMLGRMEQGQSLFPDPKCEGRCITIARVRADMKQHELAEKCYSDQATVSTWERGKIRPDWIMLEGILPELKEIRKKGCDAYCDHRDKCLVTGECYYGRYRVKG